MGCFNIHYGEFDGKICCIPFSDNLTVEFLPIISYPGPCANGFKVEFSTCSKKLSIKLGGYFYADLRQDIGREVYMEISSKFGEYFSKLIDFGANRVVIKESELEKKITDVIEEVLQSKKIALGDLRP